MTRRTLNILKRFSLADLGDGWADCYVLYQPMTVGELQTFASLKTDTLTETESMQLVVDQLKKHVISGKVSLVDDAGKVSLDDLTPEDVETLPLETLTTLFKVVSGASIDPKVSRPTVSPKTPAPNELTLTPQPSSTDSPVA